MNNGQFSGIAAPGLVASGVPVGSVVRFPTSTPLEVTLPNGEVYLRVGELSPEISRYNARFPRHMISELGAIGNGAAINTTTAWNGSNLSGCYYPLTHGSTEHGLVFGPSGEVLHSVNITGGTDVTNLAIDTLTTGNAFWTYASNGSVGIALRSLAGNTVQLWRTVDANFLTGWSLRSDVGGTTNTAFSQFIVNLGTTWIATSSWSSGTEVRRSIDNGVTWNSQTALTLWPELNPSPHIGNGSTMATVIPGTNTVLVAVSQGVNLSPQTRAAVVVRRSTDSGATYPTASTIESNGIQTRAMGFAAGNGLVLLLTSFGDVFISRDQGVSWRKEGFVPVVAFSNAEPVAPGSSNNRLFFKNGRFWITAGLSNGIRNRVVVYCSTDGINWSSGYVNTGATGTANASIVNPTSSGVAIFHGFQQNLAACSRNILPFGQYVNNAVPAESSTLASGTASYIRVV